MRRIAVNSSNLESVGYDPQTRVLEIEFKDHSIYQYQNVPQSVHKELMEAESHGKYFAKFIRNVYQYMRVN